MKPTFLGLDPRRVGRFSRRYGWLTASGSGSRRRATHADLVALAVYVALEDERQGESPRGPRRRLIDRAVRAIHADPDRSFIVCSPDSCQLVDTAEEAVAALRLHGFCPTLIDVGKVWCVAVEGAAGADPTHVPLVAPSTGAAPDHSTSPCSDLPSPGFTGRPVLPLPL